MSTTRMIIMELESSERVRQWAEHWALVKDPLRDPSAAQDPSHRFVWQIASGNHRAIARSVRAHASADDAEAEVRTICMSTADLGIRLLRITHPPTYAWVGSLAAAPVVVSARAYSTMRDMRDSVTVALSAFTTESLAIRSRVPTGSGRRR